MALEEVIDQPLAEYDLKHLIQESQQENLIIEGPSVDENQLFQQRMHVQSSHDVEFSRVRESNFKEGVRSRNSVWF